MTAIRAAEIYEKNLEVLKRRFPHIHDTLRKKSEAAELKAEIFINRMGHINARIFTDGGMAPYYQEEDIPRATAYAMREWQLSGRDMLFCVGMGLGYLPMMAADIFRRKKEGARPRIVIFERLAAMLRLAMQSLDLRRLLEYDGLEIHLVEAVDAVHVINRHSFRIFLGKQRVVTDGDSKRLFGAPFAELEKEVISCIGVVKDLWYTTKALGPRIFSNSVNNLPSLFSGMTLGRVRGALKGLPAVCIAAGPSLDAALPQLKKMEDRAVMMAVDSAVPTLASAGIRPHMVVTADARSINFRKYRAHVEALRDTILVYALESNPDNVSKFLSERKLAVSISNPVLERWLNRHWDLECALPSMTTVTHAAVFTAMGLGADPIVLVGMDMAFPDGRSHADGAMHHYRLNPDGLVSVDGVSGLPVQTYRPLSDYRIQIEKVITGRKERFINTSIEGAWIEGTIVKSFEEVLKTDMVKERCVSRRLDEMPWTGTMDITAVSREISQMLDGVGVFIRSCREGEVLAEKAFRSLSNGADEPDEKETHMSAALRHWEQFETSHRFMIDMLWGTRLEAIKEIELRNSELTALEAREGAGAAAVERMAILKATFASHQAAATAFEADLSKVMSRYERYHLADHEIFPQDLDERLADARVLAEAGDVYHAERLYEACRKAAPLQSRTALELVDLYTRFEMWQPALRVMSESLEQYAGDPAVLKKLQEVRRQINGLCDGAVEALLKGDRDKARIMIFEYLAVFPEDKLALALKSMLAAELTQKARQLVEGEGDPPEFIDERQRLDLAEKLAANGRWDRAIGVLNSVAKSDDAVLAAECHGRLGDLWRANGDISSARWHYERALALGPEDEALQDKLTTVEGDTGSA